ncbi:MAG: universal stress protein [Gemmatimonadetes bacterium]|nr:universal stress protein [Gemmatimonadota bacterium]
MIVLGTHGRSGLPRLLLGSVAESTLRQAGCTVLVIPNQMPTPVRSERSAADVAGHATV